MGWCPRIERGHFPAQATIERSRSTNGAGGSSPSSARAERALRMHVFVDGNLVPAPTCSTAGRSLSDVGWRASQLVLSATSQSSTVEFADATPDKSFWASMVGDVNLKQLSP